MSNARFPTRHALVLAAAVLLGCHSTAALALDSDRQKPATIEADEVEFDFRTGKRTYKGNVIVTQGTLRITGDKMVVEYDQDNDQIEKATSWGEPATFKQRPEGKKHDVYGEGNTIIMNEIEDTLTLIDNASMTQAGNTAKGKEIVYDIGTDKMTVKGMRRQTGGGETVTTDEDTGRARVIITPEEQAAAGDEGDGEGSGDDDKQSDSESTGSE